MIELQYQNGSVFVYKVKDWEVLRKEYRIVGELFGNTSFLPVLPLRLTPEEVFLLVSKDVAKLIEYEKLDKEPQDKDVHFCKDLTEKLKEALKKQYKEDRKRQLESFIDNIVAAKRKKGNDGSREDIFEKELNKMPDITDDNMIYPILLNSTDNLRGEPKQVPIESLLDNNITFKCKVFIDLWDKGYYITSGTKFGGDYLVYEGDPILFHAVYIVRCIKNKTEQIHPSEIVAFGRLANCVKKKAVFAFVEEDKVSYMTLSWPHM